MLKTTVTSDPATVDPTWSISILKSVPAVKVEVSKLVVVPATELAAI